MNVLFKPDAFILGLMDKQIGTNVISTWKPFLNFLKEMKN